MTGTFKGPHFEDHAAPIVEAAEPAYALIGALITTAQPVDGTTHHVLVGGDVTRPVRPDLAPLFQFFSIPRARTEAEAWLTWAGAPDDVLEAFTSLDILVRIDTATPDSTAASLTEMRLAAQCYPLEPDERTLEGHLPVTEAPGGTAKAYISVELATALWPLEGVREDVPASVQRIAALSGQSPSLTARKMLSSVPELIEQGLVRIEWVTP